MLQQFLTLRYFHVVRYRVTKRRLSACVHVQEFTLSVEADQHSFTETEESEAERHTSVRAKVIHEAIRRDGEEELNRTAPALAWSAIASGLAMGFSLLAEALLRSH